MIPELVNDCEYRILAALRRISRALDVYSRKLNTRLGLTTPQLLCLHALTGSDQPTLSDLARAVNLGGSTVNGIVDRLEAKGYVVRQRSTQDRRKVFLALTSQGRQLAEQAPPSIQDRLSTALTRLPFPEQQSITQALERIVELMEGNEFHPELVSQPDQP